MTLRTDESRGPYWPVTSYQVGTGSNAYTVAMTPCGYRRVSHGLTAFSDNSLMASLKDAYESAYENGTSVGYEVSRLRSSTYIGVEFVPWLHR